MAGGRGLWDVAKEERAIQLLTAHEDAVRPKGPVRFRVASSDGSRTYDVTVDSNGWSCQCASWDDLHSPCKHIVATVRWLDPNPAPILDDWRVASRPTFSQPSWSKYDEAQQLEHQLFDRLLWDLLGGISERVSEMGKRGRPAIPIRTQILISVRKVHLCQSSRRIRGLLLALNQDGKGILPRIPNYSLPSRFLNRPVATGLLLGLIEQSGLVLRDLEDKGTVAIDSSGFCTSCMGAYCTEMHNPTRRHRWVKAHIAVGVKTHVVLSVVITDEHGADYTQFGPLLKRVKAVGHTPSRAVADKAYLGRENFAIADALKIDPYIPFKVNSRGLSKGSPIWTRKYHEFMSKRDEFDALYHQRSNVEATFSAIKRKLGEPLLSRTQIARMNETLAKVLAYNVGVIIQQSHLHGLPPGPIGFQAPKAGAKTTPIEEAS